LNFIEEHNLHDALQDKALALMTLDPKRAVALLVQQTEFIKPYEVVSQHMNFDELVPLLEFYFHEEV